MGKSSRTPVVIALGAAQTLAWASPYYLPAMLAVPMARDLGVDVPTVFAAFSAALIVSALLGPHAGRAIDRWGGRPVPMATNLVFALGLTGLVGPAQVGGRLLEFGVLRRIHLLLSARLAALMHPVGTTLLALLGAPAAAAFAILHGAANGILTIAKGTLPLVLFGPQGYGERQGILMLPARVAQALAPWVFGVCLDRWGVGALWLSAALGLSAFGALLLLPKAAGTQPEPATAPREPVGRADY